MIMCGGGPRRQGGRTEARAGGSGRVSGRGVYVLPVLWSDVSDVALSAMQPIGEAVPQGRELKLATESHWQT